MEQNKHFNNMDESALELLLSNSTNAVLRAMAQQSVKIEAIKVLKWKHVTVCKTTNYAFDVLYFYILRHTTFYSSEKRIVLFINLNL